MQLQKQQIYLIAGVALAGLAVFMAKMYLDQRQKAIDAAIESKYLDRLKNQSSVLVATKNIPVGAAIDPNSVEATVIPNEFVPPGAVTSLNRIDGMVAIAPISQGEQLTLNKLAYSKKTVSGLAEVTPQGKRGVTVSVDNVSALAGMIKAGDYVDVIIILPIPVQTTEGKTATQVSTLPLFQNVMVLAVGQDTSDGTGGKKDEKKEMSPLITLALSPHEANLISFAQEQGKIRLIMRSQADSKIDPIQPVSWDTLLQYIYPQQAPVQYKDSDYVEIFRGLKKERVLLNK